MRMNRDAQTSAQHLTEVLDELLRVPLRDVEPKHSAGPLWAALEPVGPLSVLSVGSNLDRAVREKLVEGGCEVAAVATLADALSSMELQFFDAVVVDPHVDGDGLGVKFVRAIKHGIHEREHSLEFLVLRYARVPFVIRPVPGDTQYAVFFSGGEWYLSDSLETSLADAVLRSGTRTYLAAGTD